MKISKLIIIATSLACLLIAGCGDSNIAKVKEGTLGGMKELTIGSAFDNYKYFSKTTWESKETDNGVKYVEFKGDYNIKPLLKNTDYANICLVMQFIIKVDKGFEPSYLGIEEQFKDGKTKDQKLYDYQLPRLIRNIFQNKDTLGVVAPKMIHYKITKVKTKQGQELLGPIIDNYKCLESGKWAVKNGVCFFKGQLKLDEKARKLDITKLTFIYAYGKFNLGLTFKDKVEREFDIPGNTMFYTALQNGSSLLNIIDPIESFKDSKLAKALLKNKFLSSKRLSVASRWDAVTFSGICPQSKLLKQAGIKERRVFLVYSFGSNMSFFQKASYIVDTYNNGQKTRINVKENLRPSIVCLDKISELCIKGKDCSESISPLALLQQNKKISNAYKLACDSSKYELVSVKGTMCSYKLIKHWKQTWNLQNRSGDLIQKVFPTFLTIKAEIDLYGRSCKIHKVTMEVLGGKTHNCSTDPARDSNIPNPLYYIARGKKMPYSWFGDLAALKKELARNPRVEDRKASRDFTNDVLRKVRKMKR